VHRQPRQSRRTRSRALRSALIYAGAATTWIIVSDLVFSRLDTNSTPWNVGKGIAFVLATSLLVHRLVAANENRVREADLRARDEVRDILDQTEDLVYIADLDGRWLMVNQALATTFGIDPSEAIGRPRSDFMPTEWADQHRANDVSVVSSDTPTVVYEDLEVRGEVRHYRSMKVPVKDRHGVTYAVAGMSSDITVEHQLRRELAESADAFLTLFAGNPHPMMVVDTEDMTILEVNDAAIALYGYPADELVGMDVRRLRPEAEVGRFEQYFAHRKDVRHDLATGFSHCTASGRRFDVEVDSVRITRDGRPAILAHIRDVSAAVHRRRTDQLLLALGRMASQNQDDNLLVIVLDQLRELTDSTVATLTESPGHEPIVVGADAAPPFGEHDLILDVDMGRHGTEAVDGHDGTALVRLTGKVGGYTDDDRASVELVLHEVARLRSREELVLGLRLAAAEQFETLEGITKAVGSIVEMRDPYTAGHQQRVGDLAMEIGRRMGVATDRLEGLRIGGYLHDVGKVAVPTEILTRTGPLSRLERQLIEKHSRYGREILVSVPFPWPIAQIAAQHHERLDGSGYPLGLRGDEICLEARITAVADVFDAMTSARPYRASLDPQVAIAELRSGSGTRYDPAAVEALVAIVADRPAGDSSATPPTRAPAIVVSP
jgi:PAS domain S-box-containing protein/putative nucleotidyltransferase with HDIG domain